MDNVFKPMKWQRILDECNRRDMEAMRLKQLIQENEETLTLTSKLVTGQLFKQ